MATSRRSRSLTTPDALAQLAFLVIGTLDRRASAHDLSLVQTRLLGVLRDRTPTMNQLASLLSLDKSSATGLVDRAERRGLVTRVPSESDRRAIHVSLTDSGRELVAEVSAAYARDVSSLMDHLDAADRAALVRLAGRLVTVHAAERGVDLFDSIDGSVEA